MILSILHKENRENAVDMLLFIGDNAENILLYQKISRIKYQKKPISRINIRYIVS